MQWFHSSNMIRFWLFFLAVLAVIFCAAVNGVEVKNLYVAKVSVDSQSSQARSSALKKALQSVLVKVSGQPSVLDHEKMKQASNKYNYYLSQYSYERSQGEILLVASFNEDKVKKLFLDANVAIWGSLRPQVLLWLVEEQGLSRSILSESSVSELPRSVAGFSERRGLPITIPLMDLTDANAVHPADLWGRFEEPVLTASDRYFAEAVVVMRLSDSSLLPELVSTEDCEPLCQQVQNSYLLDWSLISADKQSARQAFGQKYRGSDKALLLEQALGDITHLIYQRYALATTMKNDYFIDVANINSLASYVGVSTFLQDLSAVSAVTLVAANGTNRRFKLNLIGSKSAFLSSLKLNKQLKQYIDPLAPVDLDAVPVFYWNKQ